MTNPDPQRPIVAPPPLNDGPRYGRDRFHSPRRYTCAHDECPGVATTLARADAHEVNGQTRTHNCCGDHDQQPATDEKD